MTLNFIFSCIYANFSLILHQNINTMRKQKFLLAVVLLMFGSFAIAQDVKVKTGIEVLRERDFDVLQGKRVGLCTNPTGVDRN